MLTSPAITITTDAAQVRKLASNAGRPFATRYDDLVAKAHPDGITELAFIHAGRSITLMAHRSVPYGGRGEPAVLRVLGVDAEPANERIVTDTLAACRRALENRDPITANKEAEALGAAGWPA